MVDGNFMDNKSKGFESLDVWKYSLDLTKTIYKITSTFPKEEIFGLTNQIRRASVSIGSNIAEGSAKNSGKEFLRYISIALGSSAEVKAQILIAFEIGFLNEENKIELLDKINKIGKMLKGLENSLRRKEND
jgi:four helix bundle protein